jgi:hypothetical protein
MPSRPFEIRLTDQAQKDLKRLRSWTEQVVRTPLLLEDESFRGHTLTGSLRDTRSLEFALNGAGAYRAVYGVHADDQVCIAFIGGPHENLYDKAERRFEALRRAGQI